MSIKTSPLSDLRKQVVRMLEIEIPNSEEKIIKYIKALKYQLIQDKRELDKQIDKQIHLEALKCLEKALKTIYTISFATLFVMI